MSHSCRKHVGLQTGQTTPRANARDTHISQYRNMARPPAARALIRIRYDPIRKSECGGGWLSDPASSAMQKGTATINTTRRAGLVLGPRPRCKHILGQAPWQAAAVAAGGGARGVVFYYHAGRPTLLSVRCFLPRTVRATRGGAGRGGEIVTQLAGRAVTSPSPVRSSRAESGHKPIKERADKKKIDSVMKISRLFEGAIPREHRAPQPRFSSRQTERQTDTFSDFTIYYFVTIVCG